MSGYKRSTIRRIIRHKLDKFFASILDDDLRDRMKRDTLVTGGAISSMLLGEKVNDYDIYFKTKETTVDVAKYFVAQFNTLRSGADAVLYEPAVKEEGDRILIHMQSAGVAGAKQEPYRYFEAQAPSLTDDFAASLTSPDADELGKVEEVVELVKTPKHEYKPVFLTDNAITLTDRVQIIIRFYGSPEEIHHNFDFVHCMGVYDYVADTLILPPALMESCLSKTLVYNGSVYPMASILRTRKFLRRGWRIGAGQMIKMMHQISGLDLEDPNVLKEQLMGVDVAYMHQLITALQNREPGQRIDSTYLAAIIDTIFED